MACRLPLLFYTKSFFHIRVMALVILLLTGFLKAQAQESLIYDDPEKAYKKALELFEGKNYIEARRLFRQTIEHETRVPDNPNQTFVTNAKIYEAFCAFELNQPDAGKLLEEAMKLIYGEPPLKRYAYYYMGKYYFKEKKYSDAIEYFEKSDPQTLSRNEQAEYKFQLAYCYFYKKRLDEAESLLKETRNIRNKYYYPSNYYYGYIAFQKKNFDAALESFERIKDSKVYAKIIPYYISQVYYFRKEYTQLIDYLSPLITDSDLKYYAELNQILGQTYFELGQYDKAIRHLTTYIRESGKARNEDIYQLGYAYYKTGNCHEAILQLEQLDNLNDTLGQFALFTLADCYLRNSQKGNARSAFEKSAKMQFDPLITEESLFSFAKLSYELGYTSEAITAFQHYLKRYQNPQHTEEAKELLTELLLTTHNYKEALLVIESIKNPSPRVKQAYQEVAFNRGVELYNDGLHEQAIAQFDQSLRHPVNATIRAQAYYWKGEACFAIKDYACALQQYLQFIDLSKITPFKGKDWYDANAYYGAGYALMKQNRYAEALPYFKEAISRCKSSSDRTLSQRVWADALLRAADCNFMIKDYQAALNSYSQVIDSKQPGADYAAFQKGIILGLIGKTEDKAAMLETFENRYPGSIYADDALFEAATAYIALNKYPTALQLLNRIIEKFPNSNYASRAYLKQGLVYYNQNDVESSIKSYRKVIEKYPSSEDAQQALLAIRQISITEGNPHLYLDIVNATPGMRISASEQDSISYLAAETQFASGKCTEAEKAFSDYISRFADGYFLLNAHFYRGECYYASKKFQEALQDYQHIIEAGKSMFYEKALAKAASIAFNSKMYADAYSYFKLLLENASFKENIYAARLGLMRCAFHMQKTSELKDYATILLNIPDAPSDHKTEAEFYLAKVALQEKDYDTASRLFRKTSESTTSEIGSEAKYRLAEISFMKGNHQQSLDECLAMIEMKPSHEYWRAKTFVLLAMNYHKLGNTFQAKATLQSVIDNYQGDDDVKESARARLQEILNDEKSGQKVQIVHDSMTSFEEDTTERIELIIPIESDTIKE
ncbi:MAG: hypothetical protein KatS3mg031_2056 [Chitinophagales bacterium]|nr:MAG: hypothetical protein KatS3mg031_2056 [Chitinophagales bacterium]